MKTRKPLDEKTINAWLEIMTSASIITQIDSATAIEAAKCQLELTKKAKISKQNTPSLFDAIVQATAKISQCKIVTGDEHFKNLPETIWIE